MRRPTIWFLATTSLIAWMPLAHAQEREDRFPSLSLFGSGEVDPDDVPAELKGSQPLTAPLAVAGSKATSTADIAAVKRALDHVGKGKIQAATEVQATITDPVARKVVEWAILRAPDTSNLPFSRFADFARANPSWPSVGLIRRRAEAALWEDRADTATILAYFGDSIPGSAKGKLALARAKLTRGDRAGAQALVRDVWRREGLSSDLESQALSAFGELLSRADHKARMDSRLYDDDAAAGVRAAMRLGGADIAIAKARQAVEAKHPSAGAMLDSVPGEAQRDPGYIFSRIRYLRRNDRYADAVELMRSAPRDANVLHDTDEWWIERRLLIRKLIEEGDPRTAYQIARDAASPAKENYRAEHQFMAGWVALRFLNDPNTAMRHFAQIGRGISNPIALARAGYWQGRAAEAAGNQGEARRHYQAAARFGTAYYGQLARAKLGQTELALHRPPSPGPHHRNLEIVRAMDILYASGNRDLVIPVVADLGTRSGIDAGALAAMAESARRHKDARAMLLVGKGAQGRGLPFDHYAFPDIGIPQFSRIGPEIDRSVVYAIARQESAFNQKTVSSANAMGLMQVTPGAGKTIAKKFKVAFNQKRLLSDPVYNTQMGAAEIGDLIEDYRGSYILAFAAYNAGRGRVREWLQRFGDPREPDVDPIDWVERIPFSETRNYVQRVLENLQVYRVRLGGAGKLRIEADLRGTAKQ